MLVLMSVAILEMELDYEGYTVERASTGRKD
jgi:hypothetical protein